MENQTFNLNPFTSEQIKGLTDALKSYPVINNSLDQLQRDIYKNHCDNLKRMVSNPVNATNELLQEQNNKIDDLKTESGIVGT